jgi:mono/diheme cytochrome c family protein
VVGRVLVRVAKLFAVTIGLSALLVRGAKADEPTKVDTTGAPSASIDFNRDIRPILSDNCFACHGPDEKERQAGLRLDQRAAATKAAESGAVAIVPGKVEATELIKRVTSTDEGTRMPPLKGKHKPLTASQIELLKRWVASGAVFFALGVQGAGAAGSSRCRCRSVSSAE